MSLNGYQLQKIEIYVLKVHVNCHGCKQKVKKLLRKIEGVLSVNIDIENQMVTVTGNVDPNTLTKQLARAGKRAEIWSLSSNQEPDQEQSRLTEVDRNKHHKQYLSALKDEQILPTFCSGDEDGWGFHNYLNQNIPRNSTISDRSKITMMERNTGDFQILHDEGNFAEHSLMANTMFPTAFGRNGAGFVSFGEPQFGGFNQIHAGLPPYATSYLPYMMKHRRWNENDSCPSVEMLSRHIQDRYANNQQVNLQEVEDTYLQQRPMMNYQSL